MQRLFSMFPAGAAGFGLLVLRLCAAALLVRYAQLVAVTAMLWWETAALVVLVTALAIGVFTPAICLVSFLIQVVLLAWAYPRGLAEGACSVGLTLSLLFLGPGAFSVDGRLFGRRRIQISTFGKDKPRI